jgi:hypothetical protein
MNGNPEPNDARRIWLSQTTEGITPPVEEVRRRAARSRAKARRARLTAIVAVAVNFIAVAAVLVAPSGHPARPWLEALQLASLVLWFFYFTPQQAAEWNRLLTLDLDSKRSPCLDFYRRELVIRRDRYRWNLKAVPLVVILLVPFVLRRYLVQAAIMSGLLLVFLTIAYVRKKRDVPRIQAEIADLDAFERQPG